MRKYLKLLITKNDLLSLVIIIIALILSLLGSSTIFDKNIDLNSQHAFFIYATVATLSSAILDPVFEILKVESRKKKLFSITLGIAISLTIWVISFINNSIFQYIQSISKRGGFSAVSLSLLLLNLVYINYQLQTEQENKNRQDKEKILRLLKENEEFRKKHSERRGDKNGE
ncbi:hypothetical protein [Streptococcus suis]|uniref:Uncharacterized protein n=1 Tax=Streptococcus suis TaxID=1307 RepID=A0A9X4RSQ8_STRSU|nr:hypothetical protein [Streptococcus suis]MBY5025962.1 hypothetical protein [Streptococcus suis]MDG4527100.1 hypothetical protein [Streptococcus suis]MDG4529524.1 hypothetical protein [Streptococcus suis]QZT17512.1 hypothetical protein K6974_00285 [Streptococcus suis]HEL2442259.1 hypothetical protein [Streptococcus suis]